MCLCASLPWLSVKSFTAEFAPLSSRRMFSFWKFSTISKPSWSSYYHNITMHCSMRSVVWWWWIFGLWAIIMMILLMMSSSLMIMNPLLITIIIIILSRWWSRNRKLFLVIEIGIRAYPRHWNHFASHHHEQTSLLLLIVILVIMMSSAMAAIIMMLMIDDDDDDESIAVFGIRMMIWNMCCRLIRPVHQRIYRFLIE